MGHASFQIDDDIEEWIEDRMAYGQSKSAWYRYASRTMRSAELALDEIYEPYQYDERREAVIEALEMYIEEKKKENDNM